MIAGIYYAVHWPLWSSILLCLLILFLFGARCSGYGLHLQSIAPNHSSPCLHFCSIPERSTDIVDPFLDGCPLGLYCSALNFPTFIFIDFLFFYSSCINVSQCHNFCNVIGYDGMVACYKRMTVKKCMDFIVEDWWTKGTWKEVVDVDMISVFQSDWLSR